MQNPFVYKMNLGVNCLSIKNARPNDSLLNTDKNAGEDGGGGCVYKSTQSCVPCFAARVQMPQVRCWQGTVCDLSRDMTWLGYHLHKEFISVEMQNTEGLGSWQCCS